MKTKPEPNRTRQHGTRVTNATTAADILLPQAKAPAVEANPYADEPTPAVPVKPWTPAVGDVVTLKSGGPKMTVMRPAKGYDGEPIEGEWTCMWANDSDTHMIHANPATLQPA